MGEDSDIAELIGAAQKARAIARRNAWLYGALVFVVTIASSLVTTTWAIRGAFDEFKISIRDVVQESAAHSLQLKDANARLDKLGEREHENEIKTEANRVCCAMVQSSDSHMYRKPGSATP